LHSQEKLDCAAEPATQVNSSKAGSHLDVGTRMVLPILHVLALLQMATSHMLNMIEPYYAHFAFYEFFSTNFMSVIC
jgi:hypothetical protein